MTKHEIHQRAADILARMRSGFRFHTPGWPPGHVPTACDEQMGALRMRKLHLQPQRDPGLVVPATPWRKDDRR